MNKKWNKKGFFFSLLLMFMLIMLFSMALVSKEISRQDYEVLESLLLAKKIRYIESDVATDFLNILNISVNASKTNFTISNLYLKDYSKNLSLYNDFLKSYSNHTNIGFVANVSNEIFINSNLLNFSNTSIFYNDTLNLKGLTIEIKADELSSGGIEFTPSDSGAVVVNCVIRNSALIVLYNKTRYLDLNSYNSAFGYSSGGKNVSLNVSNARLILNSNATTTITRITFDFNNDYAYGEVGEISFEEYLGLIKDSRILLAKG